MDATYSSRRTAGAYDAPAAYPTYAPVPTSELHTLQATYLGDPQYPGLPAYPQYTVAYSQPSHRHLPLASPACPSSLVCVTGPPPPSSSPSLASAYTASPRSTPSPVTPHEHDALPTRAPKAKARKPAAMQSHFVNFAAGAPATSAAERGAVPRVFVHRLYAGNLVPVQDGDDKALMPWLELSDEEHDAAGEVQAAGGASGKVHQCKTCRKWFDRPSSLAAHQVSHSDERLYKCTHPDCDKYFSVPSNARRHGRSHTGGLSPFPSTVPSSSSPPVMTFAQELPPSLGHRASASSSSSQPISHSGHATALSSSTAWSSSTPVPSLYPHGVSAQSSLPRSFPPSQAQWGH